MDLQFYHMLLNEVLIPLTIKKKDIKWVRYTSMGFAGMLTRHLLIALTDHLSKAKPIFIYVSVCDMSMCVVCLNLCGRVADLQNDFLQNYYPQH